MNIVKNSNISRIVKIYLPRMTHLNINPLSCYVAKQYTSFRKEFYQPYFAIGNVSKQHERNGLLHSLTPFYQVYYLKSYKSRSKKNKQKESSDEDDDDDEEEEDDDEWTLVKGPNFKDIKVKVVSMRMDAIAKAGFGLSRNHIEESFYANKIKLNKKKISKKSQMIYIGDSLDLFSESSADNEERDFGRVTVLKIGSFGNSDKIPVLLRKYPKLNNKEEGKNQ